MSTFAHTCRHCLPFPQDRINDLCCKLKMYGITETSNQENMQIINSLLDRRTPDDIVTANEGVIEKKILEGEGGVEGGKGDGCEGERGGGGEGGRGGQGEGGEGGVEGGKSDGCERERGGRGEGGGGGGEGRVESGFGEELVRERERVGEEGRGGEGERGAKLLDEEDRGWLSISRQIMMDVSELVGERERGGGVTTYFIGHYFSTALIFTSFTLTRSN